MLKWIKRRADGATPNKGRGVESEAGLDRPVAPRVLDLTDPQTIGAFKDIARELRVEKPVCPVKSGGFLLTDPADIKAGFSNKALSNRPSRFSALASKNMGKYTAASVAANIPPFLDAPEHVDVRRWLSRAFFDRFKEFEPEISGISKCHVGKLSVDQEYLLIEAVAREFVVEAIGAFVGIAVTPVEMKEFTGALFRLFAPAQDAKTFAATNQALSKAREELVRVLKERRLDQVPSLLTTLDKSNMSFVAESERDLVIVDNALLILADGVENVEAAIGQVMMQWFDLPDRPEIITPEFVRYAIHHDTPGQTIPRIATQELRINDELVAAGTPVFFSLASANASSGQSEEFSFGLGRHKCIGEQLAIAMITTFCDDLLSTEPVIGTSDLEFAPMFGHKWPRGVKFVPTRGAGD